MRRLIALSMLLALPATAQDADPRTRLTETFARVRAARPDLDPDTIVRAGIDGMLKTLDARTRYMTQADIAASRAARPEPQTVTGTLVDGVVVVTLPTLNVGAAKAVAARLAEVDPDRRARAIVLDLRGNPGGLLLEAVQLADLFLDDGEIVTQRGRNLRDVQRYSALKRGASERRPLAVLVDKGSAAGAEIVAAALQARGRAQLFGERTAGAGTVQTFLPVSATAAVSLTTSRVFTPGGTMLDGVGVTPGVAVASADALSAALARFRP